MYRITNRAFEPIYEKYSVRDIFELTAEQLDEVCNTDPFRMGPVLKRNERKQIVGIDRLATATVLEQNFTFSEYMGELFWEQRHRDIANDIEILEQLKTHQSGTETFELMARYKFGISKLKPKQSAEVDWTPRWVREVWKNKPMSKFCKLEDLEPVKPYPFGDKKEEEKEEEVEEKEEKTDIDDMYDLSDLPYMDLMKEARESGIKDRRMPRKDLEEAVLKMRQAKKAEKSDTKTEG